MAKKKSNATAQQHNNNEDEDQKKIVLKLHLHCKACTSRIRKSILSFPGVHTVEFEGEDKAKITSSSVAIVDVNKLKQTVEKKTGKTVDIVSPQPKKDKQNNNKNNTNENDKPKESPMKTVVFKVSWHCFGCGERIHKIVSSFKGVYEVSIDKEKDEVKVIGKMDTNKLMAELQHKLKRPVHILPDKKDNNNNNNKKDNTTTNKNKDKSKADHEVTGPRIEHYVAWPIPPHLPYYYGDQPILLAPSPSPSPTPGQAQFVDPYSYQYYYHYPPPHCFSDENPHAACSVM